MKILGVDPGIHGGLAIVSLFESGPRLIDAIDVPTVGTGAKERIDVIGLQQWLLEHSPYRAFIERAQAMPRQDASSGFKYGRAAGAIEAIIAANGISFEIVEPSMWKRALRLRGKDKERRPTLQLFPHAHHPLKRKMDHQRAEAALIAYVGLYHLMLVKLAPDPTPAPIAEALPEEAQR
jgi:Holliday junction resolvasome RuvABC endonuclease subunit